MKFYVEVKKIGGTRLDSWLLEIVAASKREARSEAKRLMNVPVAVTAVHPA